MLGIPHHFSTEGSSRLFNICSKCNSTSSTIMFIIFRQLGYLSKFSFPHKWNSVIVGFKLVHTSWSRVAEQLKIWDVRKLGNIRKVSNFIELLPSAQSSCRNLNFASTSKNLLKDRNWTFPAFHMKTRVCLKYFVNDCSPWKVSAIFPIVLYTYYLNTTTVILSYCLTHHGALLRLSYYFISWLLRYHWSWPFITSLQLLQMFLRCLSRSYLVFYVLRGNRFKHWMNSSVIWFVSNSIWVALERRHASSKLYALPSLFYFLKNFRSSAVSYNILKSSAAFSSVTWQ